MIDYVEKMEGFLNDLKKIRKVTEVTCFYGADKFSEKTSTPSISSDSDASIQEYDCGHNRLGENVGSMVSFYSGSSKGMKEKMRIPRKVSVVFTDGPFDITVGYQEIVPEDASVTDKTYIGLYSKMEWDFDEGIETSADVRKLLSKYGFEEKKMAKTITRSG